ncbi:MAG: type II toxin-antitoxin system RelB/DinJ family antitoxin [Clostridia bacterium]|nr:type II toxin-antitoxin system RelB/DinJ family antitoxin [Clostridia bacterium]
MTSISVRMDDALKEAFEAACEDMGMPMAVALTIFAKRVARDRRIPFDVSAPRDSFYSESNMRAIEEAKERVKNGHYIVKTIEELEAMTDA